jgi:hypothetical protein
MSTTARHMAVNNTQAFVLLHIHPNLIFPVIIPIVSRALRYDDAFVYIQAVP